MGEGHPAVSPIDLPLSCVWKPHIFCQTMKALSVIAAFLILSLPCMCQAQGASGSALDTNTRVKASENYKITALDVLHFRIIGEADTDCEVRVAMDGSITLPYIGTIKVLDMSVAQARQFIYEKYAKDYFVDPQVDLVIVAYKQRRVNVQGMVNRQGFVVFPPEEKMTVLGAIALAGGWSDNRLADRRRVRLTYTTSDGQTRTDTLNLDGSNPDDREVSDGDRIYVEERNW